MITPLTPRPRTSTVARHRVIIVASTYNSEFVERMTEKARAEIATIEPETKVEVVLTPGSFEIPFLAAKAVEILRPDAVICLGVIFRGETGHADLVAASVSDALCRLSVEKRVPVIHGVLLLNDREQATVRCLGEEINRGTECARAAIEILRSSRAIVPM